MRITQTQARHITIFFIALLMSCVMSFALTAINSGMDHGFTARWLRNFGIAFVVAFPVASVVVPLVQRTVSRLVVKE